MSLFDTANVRATDPLTSHIAAASMTPAVLRKEQARVLWALTEIDRHEPDAGATARDIVMRLAYTGSAPDQNCVAKRCSELRDLVLIRDTGRTRPGKRNRPLTVWELTDAGRSLWAEGGGSDCDGQSGHGRG